MATSAMPARREVAGRGVGEVAGELGGIGEHTAALGAASPPRPPGGRCDEHELCEAGAVGLLLQRRVAVAGEQDALDDGLGRPPRRRPRRRRASWRAGRAWPPLGRSAAAASRRPAGVELGGVADADGDHARPTLARHDERLAELALEPRRGERRAVEADLARDRALHADRHAEGAGAVGHAAGDRDVTVPSMDGVGLNVARVGLGMPESLPGIMPRSRDGRTRLLL